MTVEPGAIAPSVPGSELDSLGLSILTETGSMDTSLRASRWSSPARQYALTELIDPARRAHLAQRLHELMAASIARMRADRPQLAVDILRVTPKQARFDLVYPPGASLSYDFPSAMPLVELSAQAKPGAGGAHDRGVFANDSAATAPPAYVWQAGDVSATTAQTVAELSRVASLRKRQ